MKVQHSLPPAIAALLLVAGNAVAQQPQPGDPWQKEEMLAPAKLAGILQSKDGKKPFLICTAFPVLYRAKHIVGAKFAGPGAKAEGIESLKKLVQDLPKDTDIVLYCGCCPMKQCPNLRPAFRALKEMGFTKIRALDIPTNMHTDWYTPGYPSEAGSAPEASGR
jgi:thiosulfate/3-mercaptopyruvate sulfurtransferase